MGNWSDVGYKTRMTSRFFADMEGHGLPDRAKIIGAYLIFGDQVNNIGLYRVNFSGMAEANEWTIDTSSQRKSLWEDFEAIVRCFSWVYDKKTKVLFIPSHFKYNPVHNENQLSAVIKTLSGIVYTPLMSPWLDAAKSLIKRSSKPSEANPEGVDFHKRLDAAILPRIAKVQEGAKDSARKVVEEVFEQPSEQVKPDRFKEFWTAWPNKVAKKEAVKAWKTLKPTSSLADRILVDVAARSKSKKWLKDGGQFIPHPATYLRGARWEDQAPSVGANKSPSIFDDEVDKI